MAVKKKGKSVAKRKVSKTSSKRPAAKSKAKAKPKAKSAPKAVGKVTSAYTKTELLNSLAERTSLSKKEVNSVLDELVTIIGAHLKKGSSEEFKLPGLLKMTVKKSPAKKARKGVNPFTGEEMMFKAKPASRKVKITALKNLKEMVS